MNSFGQDVEKFVEMCESSLQDTSISRKNLAELDGLRSQISVQVLKNDGLLLDNGESFNNFSPEVKSYAIALLLTNLKSDLDFLPVTE